MSVILVELVREHAGLPTEAIRCLVDFAEVPPRLEALIPLSDHERDMVMERARVVQARKSR